ncbi:MAG TPA: NAD(P)/FAD-dependent oxidoreductase [Mycobacteriales bacterium]|nr:NAD(P)/FAD-dependent oxidoreductase [Mycobacteriales bacterium]
MTPTYDAIVVGGGPAGYAAATWLARYRRKTLLIANGEHRNRSVERSHGYLGLGEVSPSLLLGRAREDLLTYEQTAVRHGTVGSARRVDDGFEVVLDGEQLTSCRLVLACGVTDDLPEVAGIEEHFGASVFTCPSCDGYEARGCDVVTLGWNEGLADFSLHLFEWARKVTIVTDGRRFEGDQRHIDALGRVGIEIVEEVAGRFDGERGDLRGVELIDGRLVPCQVAFFSIGVHPRSDLAAELGCALDDDGYVLVDPDGQTSVPGVYAAGDLTPGIHLVQVAAAEGAVAGVKCAHSLRGEPGAADSPRPSPPIEAVLPP